MNEPILIDIDHYCDNRGSFYQSHTLSLLENHKIYTTFVQDCHSVSHKNVVRGLHYQYNEPLDKLVRVSNGSIIDIIVDIRINSLTFGKVYQYELTSKKIQLLWVPAGFAHGFKSLEDNTHVQYKFTKEYNKNGESGINIFDDELNINLGLSKNKILLSDKDNNLQSLTEYKLNKAVQL